LATFAISNVEAETEFNSLLKQFLSEGIKKSQTAGHE
jgi:hypothetical protein